MVEDGRLPIPPGGKKPNIQTNPLRLCMIEEDKTVDPLSLIIPLEWYRILKESDETSDHLSPSMDYLVCDC